MHTTVSRLLADVPVVTDGAWGTELQKLGLPIGAAPDPWNLTQPDRVAQVARSYVNAGSHIILTNTFGATRLRLARHGHGDAVREINKLGARISTDAAGGRALVFASVGPTGLLPTMGEVSELDLENALDEQMAGLVEGGAQGIVIETMSDLGEAAAAARCAARTGLPVVACMTYGSGKAGDRTMMGDTPEQVAEALMTAGADVLGTNCGVGAAGMLAVCERLVAACGRPVWAKPNAGMPRIVQGHAVYDETADEFVAGARALVAAGAGFIGGCCGTDPGVIGALVTAVGRE